MQVSVESPSKLERRLTITVPSTQLDAAYDQNIAKMAKTASLKGFRKGHVPLAHVKQLYGDAARQDALNEVIETSLYAAFKQENLNPISTPKVEPKNIAPGQPLEFTATFEVLPEIEKVEFNVKKLEKKISTIGKEDIEKVIARLCEQYTKWNKVDRAAKEKDQVVIDFRGSIEGKTFEGGEAHEYPIVIGSNTMIPGFEEGILGMKASEDKTIHVTFPDNYFAKEFAGKKADFAIHAIKVSEPEAPKLDTDLVKKFGIESGKLEDLQAEIQKNLEREVERVIKAKLKEQVFDLLIAQNTLDIPQALIEQEANRIHNEVHPHHGHDHNHTADEMAQFNEPAKRNVSLSLLIGQLIKQHKLMADKERVKAHITKLSTAYEDPNEVIKWYTSDKRRLAEVEMLILEEQVIEKLLETVSITENMISYNDLIKS